MVPLATRHLGAHLGHSAQLQPFPDMNSSSKSGDPRTIRTRNAWDTIRLELAESALLQQLAAGRPIAVSSWIVVAKRGKSLEAIEH